MRVTDSYSVGSQLQHSELGEVGEILDLGDLVLNEVQTPQLSHPLQSSDDCDVVE